MEILITYKNKLIAIIQQLQVFLNNLYILLTDDLKKESLSMTQMVLGPERVRVGGTFDFYVPGVQQLSTIICEGESTNVNTSLANVKLSLECIKDGMPYQYRPIDEYLIGTLLTGNFVTHPRVPVHSGQYDTIYKIDTSNQIEAQPVPPIIYGKTTVLIEDFREPPVTEAYVWITLVME